MNVVLLKSKNSKRHLLGIPPPTPPHLIKAYLSPYWIKCALELFVQMKSQRQKGIRVFPRAISIINNMKLLQDNL